MLEVSDDDKSTPDHLLIEHHFAARAKALSETRSVVRKSLIQHGYKSPMVEDIVLAIDEACQNIIRHAYGGETDEEIVLHLSRDGESLIVFLRDFAPEVSQDAMRPRDLEDIRPGGLGCHFIQNIMDEISVNRPSTGKGNVLQMIKRIRPS